MKTKNIYLPCQVLSCAIVRIVRVAYLVHAALTPGSRRLGATTQPPKRTLCLVLNTYITSENLRISINPILKKKTGIIECLLLNQHNIA